MGSFGEPQVPKEALVPQVGILAEPAKRHAQDALAGGAEGAKRTKWEAV